MSFLAFIIVPSSSHLQSFLSVFLSHPTSTPILDCWHSLNIAHCGVLCLYVFVVSLIFPDDPAVPCKVELPSLLWWYNIMHVYSCIYHTIFTPLFLLDSSFSIIMATKPNTIWCINVFSLKTQICCHAFPQFVSCSH